MTFVQTDSRMPNSLSTANLIGFSSNRLNLTSTHSIREEPLLAKKQIILDDKNSDDYEQSFERKPSIGVTSYLDHLRKSYQLSTISFSGRAKRHQMITMVRWILLFISVVGGASFGPFMLYVQTPSTLKAVWRMEITVILLIPFIIYEKINDKNRLFFRKRVLFNPSIVQKLAVASLGNAFWMISLLISLSYTSMAHAYLFNGIPSLLIIIWRRMKGIDNGKLEAVGVWMAVAGTVIVAFDNSFQSYNLVDLAAVPLWKRLIFGDLTALIGSFFAAFFFVFNGEIREEYPLYFGIAFISVIGAAFMAPLAVIFQGATIGFSPETGILGVFTHKWFFYYVCVGLATGVSYYIIYGFVASHLSAVAVSIALYFEPVISSLIVYFLDWQSLPALLAIIGGTMVIFGMALVSIKQVNQDRMTFVDDSDSNSFELNSFS